MEEYQVRPFMEMQAYMVEVEAMKIANAERDLLSESPAYTEEDFQNIAENIRDLSVGL